MNIRRISAFVAAASTALAVSAVAFGALSPSAYRAQGNAACATAKAQEKALQTIPSATGAAAGEALETKLFVANLAIAKQEYATLRALQPPPSLRADHTRALWGLWKMIGLQTTVVDQRNAGADPKKAEGALLSYTFKGFGAARQAWAAAGLTVCATS